MTWLQQMNMYVYIQKIFHHLVLVLALVAVTFHQKIPQTIQIGFQNPEKKSTKQSAYASTKNRQKPYSRPSIEDKKVRKKEQNKNAATRYRQKKKQEIKEILGEERELTEHNEKLKNQVTDLQREIGYLKGLMRDLFRAKGLIK